MGRRPDEKSRERIVEYIKEYVSRRGFSPSIREIAKVLETSTSVVTYHLDILEDRGIVSRTPGLARTIRIVK